MPLVETRPPGKQVRKAGTISRTTLLPRHHSNATRVPAQRSQISYLYDYIVNLRMEWMNDQSKTINRILADCSVIAVVGFSRRVTRAGYYVPAYLFDQGYKIIPVNPYIEYALGQKAYADLVSIPEPVDLVLLFQRSEKVPPFVEQAVNIKARAVWMQLGIINEVAAEKARAAGLDVVMNACMLVEHRHWLQRQN